MIEYREGEIDAERVVALRARCGFAERPVAEVAAQLRGARWVVSAWEEGELVGMARAVSDGVTNGYVSSVMVDERFRRRGVGREIMRRIMEGRGRHIRWVLHAREEAKPFYRALGFTDATDILWRGRE